MFNLNGSIFGQDSEFITPIITNASVNKNASFEKFNNKSFKKSIQLVKIENVKNIIKNKKLKFSIPGHAKKN